MTAIARNELRSYKQLPQIWYQIQTKFRDEPRPKSGLLRVRQFIMKDAYSFDIDEAGLDVSYDKHDQTYRRIFTRCGLKFVAVEADSGAMGGSGSQEFMVYTDAGEDLIASCAEMRLRRQHREGHLAPRSGRRDGANRRRHARARPHPRQSAPSPTSPSSSRSLPPPTSRPSLTWRSEKDGTWQAGRDPGHRLPARRPLVNETKLLAAAGVPNCAPWSPKNSSTLLRRPGRLPRPHRPQGPRPQ